jgi:hypothetical protein
MPYALRNLDMFPQHFATTLRLTGFNKTKKPTTPMAGRTHCHIKFPKITL